MESNAQDESKDRGGNDRGECGCRREEKERETNEQRGL